MATGQILSAWVENGVACLAVRVAETSGLNVEYIGRVPIDAAWQALSNAEKKAALVEAVKAQRAAQATVAPALPSFTGPVTL